MRPSGTTEAGGDAVLGRLVAGAGAGGEAGDAGQGLMQGCAAALPFRPELEEAGLGDAGPVGPEGGDVAGELAQGALDGGCAGVELGGDLLELLGGDPDAGGGHVAPPGRALVVWSSSTVGGNRPQTNVHRPWFGSVVDRFDPPAAAGQPEQVGAALVGGRLEADQTAVGDQARPWIRSRLGSEPSRPRPSTATVAPVASTTSAGSGSA